MNKVTERRRIPWLLRWSGLLFLTVMLFGVVVLLAVLGQSIAGTNFSTWMSGNPIEMIIWRCIIYSAVAVFYLKVIKHQLIKSTLKDSDDGHFRRALLPRLERIVVVSIVLFEVINVTQRLGVI